MASGLETPDERLIIVDSGNLAFHGYEETAGFLLDNLSRGHSVRRATLVSVAGSLTGEEGSEMLDLTDGDRQGAVKRSWGNDVRGVGVSPSRGEMYEGLALIAYVEPRDSRLIDRGLAHVAIGPVDADHHRSNLSFIIGPNHPVDSASAIADSLEAAELRVDQFLQGILNSEPVPPFSQSYDGAQPPVRLRPVNPTTRLL